MTDRVLIIGPAQRASIAALIAKAENEVVPLHVMERLAASSPTAQLAARNNDSSIALPEGYCATFTIEEHKRGVPCRHLSVSVDKAARAPSPGAVACLMTLFGFKNVLGTVPCWLEDIGGGGVAVNVVEPLDGNLERIAVNG